jgi:hypothetical protein
LVARQLEIVADLSALRLTAANSASYQRGDFQGVMATFSTPSC